MSARNTAYGTAGCIYISYFGLKKKFMGGFVVDIDPEVMVNEIILAIILKQPKNNDRNAVLAKFNDKIRTNVN